jgi:hypothetical protein
MLAECLKSQVAEHLYSKCEALSSNPNTAKKKKKKRKEYPQLALPDLQVWITWVPLAVPSGQSHTSKYKGSYVSQCKTFMFYKGK